MSKAQENMTSQREHPAVEITGGTVTGVIILNNDPVVDNQAATKQYVDNYQILPINAIALWAGSTAAIPPGWYLCNGGNGTVNLQDRFIYGTATEGDIGVTGGSNNTTTISHNHTANHGHSSGNTTTNGAHTHKTSLPYDSWIQSGGSGRGMDDDSGGADTLSKNWASNTTGSHSHTVSTSTKNMSTNSTGSTSTNTNIPKYMYLGYIQRRS